MYSGTGASSAPATSASASTGPAADPVPQRTVIRKRSRYNSIFIISISLLMMSSSSIKCHRCGQENWIDFMFGRLIIGDKLCQSGVRQIEEWSRRRRRSTIESRTLQSFISWRGHQILHRQQDSIATQQVHQNQTTLHSFAQLWCSQPLRDEGGGSKQINI